MFDEAMRSGRVRRCVRWALAVALVAGLAGAASAQATVTSSSITTPADPFFGFDQGQTQNVTISGASDGTMGDEVDIDCYSDNGSTGTTLGSTVASAVPVQADGSFTTTVLLSALEQGEYQLCRLRAVPAGTTPTSGLASYAGPRVAVGYLDPTMSSGALVDFYAYAPQLTATDDYDSLGSCGLDDSYQFDPSVFGQFDSYGFYCNDFVEAQAASDPTRSGIEVDGHDAYPPAGLYYDAFSESTNGIVGFPSLTLSFTQDSADGDLSYTEQEPIDFCSGNLFPVTTGNCTALVASGVQLTRTVTQTDDGHIVYIEDAYSSTDGASHSLSLLLENDQIFANEGFGGDQVSYEFPGQSSFATHVAGDSVSVPSTAPASILIENNTVPDGGTSGARGAITYAQAPSGPFAFTAAAGYGDAVFDAPEAVTVPASGSVDIGYAYSTEFTLAAVTRDAQVAQDHFQPPAISLSSPVGGATVGASPVTVTGTAAAGSGVSSVTVNGVPASLAGSTFSASVPLAPGANTVTATVTSNSGATGSASERVTLALPATAPPLALTGSASARTSTAATLSGTLTPGGAPVSYRFQVGTTTAYGLQTSAATRGASGTASAVSARVSGLHPATTYHYRLVASGSAGASYGADRTFRTLLPPPRRITVHVRPARARVAPYRLTTSGTILLPAGVGRKLGCRGRVSVQVKHGSKVLSTRRVSLSRSCTFRSRASFSAKRLKGHGRVKLTVRFLGNSVLSAHTAAARFVRFG